MGDALGGAVEFMSRAGILQRYGGKDKITADTQMTLYTAEGLLRGLMRGLHKGVTSYTQAVAHAYLR
ncbi:hypothetical protein BG841_00460 [Marinobacter sp. X15-166B]|nr:hypothetical protein BG841_00460 [Marinobacter sp. X15-166B]